MENQNTTENTKQTETQNNDNKLLSPKASVLIQPRPRALSTGLQAFLALGAKV
jgi:hypothetical protein